MPKNQTINKNQSTSNAFQFQMDGRYFLCGCIWIALGAAAFSDDVVTTLVLIIAACVFTTKLFKKQEN